MIVQLYNGAKVITHSVEIILQILKFDLFQCICDNTILSQYAVQQRDDFA